MDERKYKNRIKEYREMRNITQRELAERLGTDIRNIRRWENGEASIDVVKAIKMAKILEASTDEIFGNSEEDI